MKTPFVPPSSADAGEAVVDPVGDEQGADPEAAHPRQPVVDVGAIASGWLRAAEEVRGFDADHDGELALLDHLPRLPRVADQPEPAAARAPALGVDVVLQVLQLLDLELDRVGLVAGVRAHGLDPADGRVLDGLRDHQPQTGVVGALEPRVIDLLVGVGVVRRPPGERGPSVGVVRAEGKPGAKQVPGHVVAAVGAVIVLVVPERLGDPEAVERLAVDDAPAGAQVRGDVEVGVGEPEHRPVGVGAPERPAGRPRPRLGIGATALGGEQPKRRAVSPQTQRPVLCDRELALAVA